MKHSRRNQISITTIISLAFLFQMGIASANKIEKPGHLCPTLHMTAKSKNGHNLVCVKKGKKLKWKVVAEKATPSPSETPEVTPSITASPSASPSVNKASTSSGATGIISADCITLLSKIMSAGRPDTSSDASQGGLDQFSTCFTDSGATQIITSAPFNLADISSVTKFRSCEGHDFAEGSADGKVTSNNPALEKFSSMKHYVTPIKQNASDRTNVFAPFDGIVSAVTADSGKMQNGSSYANPGNQLSIIPFANHAITFTFMHVYGISLKPGDTVKSGENVAYHEIQSSNTGFSSFDVVISKTQFLPTAGGVIRHLYSMMDYLAPNIAQSFAGAGLTPETAIWPAAYRVAHPCVLTGNQGFFQGPENPADRVTLKH